MQEHGLSPRASRLVGNHQEETMAKKSKSLKKAKKLAGSKTLRAFPPSPC